MDPVSIHMELRAAMQQLKKDITGSMYIPAKENLDASYIARCEVSTDNDEIFWLPCNSFSIGGDVFDDIECAGRGCEAAELFVCLSSVDFALWKELVNEFWPKTIEWTQFFALRTRLRVGLDFRINRSTCKTLCKNTQRVISWLKGSRTPEYKRTRELLAQFSSFTVPPVRLNLENWRRYGSSTHQAIQDMGNQLKKLSGVSTGQLRITHLKLGSLTIANKSVLMTLVSIHKLGIEVSKLPMIEMTPTYGACKQYCRLVCSLLDATPKSNTRLLSEQDGVVLGAKEACFCGNWLCDELVPGFFSAVQCSRSLGSMDIELVGLGYNGFDVITSTQVDFSALQNDSDRDYCESRQLLAQWLAFGLFCRESLSSITINAEGLCTQDVTWMEQVVTARNPMAVLFPEEVVIREPQIVVASEVFLYHPNDASDVETVDKIWADIDTFRVDVIGEARECYLPVLLPGWGKAWVSEDVANVSSRPSQFSSPTQLVIRIVSTTSIEAVVALIRLLGPNLKILRIDNCYRDMDQRLDDLCKECLLACPQLVEMELKSIQLSNLEFLNDVLEAQCCPYLTKLTFMEVEFPGDGEVDRLYNVLGDPQHPAANQLRTLCVDLPSHHRPTVVAALDMLSTNRHLQLLELSLRSIAFEEFQAYEAQFRAFDRTILFDPLPIRSKCAFLSLVTKYPSPAFQQFDSGICSHVLSFIAVPRLRRVRFEG